jgi:hypothetical protein
MSAHKIVANATSRSGAVVIAMISVRVMVTS